LAAPQFAYAAARSWNLKHTCPPSFETLANGTCSFRSLYQLYALPDGHGGLRAPLPPARDGFRPEEIDLGRYLFFDPVLSRDGSTSCATCHRPDRGFADGLPQSVGHFKLGAVQGTRSSDPISPRNAPTLWNVGFLKSYFWDGRASTLEEQALIPMFSDGEMANTPQVLEATLNSNSTYRSLFGMAFGRSKNSPITVAEIATALTAFESSLVSFNSRYDKYAHGDQQAMSAVEIAGFNVFRGFVARCSQCHTPPLFTNNEIAVVGAPRVPGQPYDLGAGQRNSDPALRGAFRVPTLRNIARTGPYFNAGQFSSLREVVDFYNASRGHAVPPGEHAEIHWHIAMTRPELSDADAAALVAFLACLTDESLRPQVPSDVPSGLRVAAAAQPKSSASPDHFDRQTVLLRHRTEFAIHPSDITR
jgi:cytochrome c peroxidase